MNSIWGSFSGNLIGTLYFLYFQAAGILLVSILLKKESFFTRFLIGSITGSVLLQWLPILFAFFADFTVLSHLLALLPVLPVFVLSFQKRNAFSGMTTGCRRQLISHAPFLVILLIFMLFWCYLLHTHTLVLKDDGALYTGQCTYGDMNMHLGFITSIARQQSFPPQYSLFPGTKLSYPFLSDSISSSIYIWGASLRYAYILPMVFAMLQIFGCFYLFGLQFLRSKTKALFAYILFFLNGGLGFMYFIDWAQEKAYRFGDIFTGFYTTPTNLVSHNIRWVNVIADMFLPQRATLFGYAVLFPCIWLLYRAVFDKRREYFLYAGILGGALPLIHTHSFLSLGIISAAWLLVDLYRKTSGGRDFVPDGKGLLLIFTITMCLIQYINFKKAIPASGLMITGLLICGIALLFGIYVLIHYLKKHGSTSLLRTWGLYLFCIMLLALPQLLFWTFGQVSEGGFVRGHFNWGNLGDFYPWFYLKNIGLPLLIIIPAVCTKNKKIFPLFFSAFLIWCIAELIVFTPNTYDNNKMLYVAYMLLCYPAADYGVNLYETWKEKGTGRFAGVLFLFFCIFSGILTLGREAVSEYQLYGTSHVELTDYIEENTPAEAVFLSSNRHNNEIASLTGRNIVCGSGTFLYFHGINTTEREVHLKLMYEEPLSHPDLFEKYNVSYVVISSWERANYQIDETIFASMGNLVFSHNDVQLYQIN